MKKLNLFAILLLVISVARAQDPVKVAVMDLKAKSGIDNMTVSSLTDFVCTTILDVGDYDVIGKDDMKTMMEHIADRQLLDCDDTRCLAKIGGALGVQLLVSGNIGMVGKMYLVNIKLIDIDDAVVRNRVSEKYLGDETGLVTKVEQSIHKLFGDADPETESEPVAVVHEPVAPAPAPVAEPAQPAPVPAAEPADGSPGIRFRLMAGFNLGQAMEDPAMYDDFDDYSLTPMGGFYAGAGVRIPVTGGFGLIFEPAFSQKNFVEEVWLEAPSALVLEEYYKTWFYQEYFDLMLAGDYQAGPLHAMAGLSFGFLLDAYSTMQSQITALDSWGNPVTDEYEEDFDESDYRSGGALAFVLGGGFAGRHLLADLRLSIGTTNVIMLDERSTTPSATPIPLTSDVDPFWSLFVMQFILGYQF